MLIGEYKHNVDVKGRLIVPAKFREDLGASFVLTRGLDGCLFGYPKDNWDKLETQLKELPLTKKNARAFTRMLYSGASEAEIDRQGRINIPENLKEFAAITKECRIIGVSDRIEVWSEERWAAFSKAAEDNFEEIAEDMFDFDF